MLFVQEFMRDIHKLVFLVDKNVDRLLRKHERMGFSQFLLLHVAAHCDGPSQTDIAKRLGVTEALISRQTDRLVRQGFLTKRYAAHSRRTHALKLTAEGRKKLDHLMELIKGRFGGLERIVPRRDQRRVLSYLSQMIRLFELREKGQN